MMILELIRDCGRKYGPVLRLWYQSEGQLKEIWGPQSTTKWYESLSYRSYAAIQSLETAKEISGIGGTYAVMAYSEGENTGRNGGVTGRSGARSSGRNTNRHEISRLLVKPEEITSARTDEQFLIVRGLGLARCGRAISFRRPDMAAKLARSRFYRGDA
jgi:type IV secretion system protein VirD4